ncbi:hypothetical protein PYCCODRAFT_1436310 [Trametes coccinea BRFM310]|uniref:Uncharacterized protein n=1 Tax=Trametes coccinea (strain BRFM310) TaxID=1353009 RepID=A0A1Y2ILB7_TRAC3|nr:hypothetical protein PYCCODRAFT_1436310 [Trametes coccinea BRFM310]
MSAITAHYASASSAAAAADRRYADIAAAQYDSAFFQSYSPPSLNTVAAAASLDAGYASGASYAWDAHEPGPAVQSPSYPASSSSSSSTNNYHNPASSSPSSAATTSHSSVTASFSSYTAQPDAYPLHSSHRGSFPTSRSHHPNSSLSSSTATSSNPYSPTLATRSSYASGTRSYSSLAAAAAATTHSSGSSPTPRLQNASWDSAGLYTIEPIDPVSPPHHAYSHSNASSTPATPPTPPIKEEEQEGEFIIEVSVPADPVPSSMPEVPLRATHAPPEMRKMMYSFRLESFAMHDGIRSAATAPGSGGIEVGPLRQPPVELEWQAHILVPLVPDDEIEPAHRYSSSSLSTPRSHGGYGVESPTMSPRKADHTSPRRTRATNPYATAGSASPALSLEYPSGLENEAWDGSSSGYGSVADNSSAGGTAATSSPTFAPIMTPAQSLGWLRFGAGSEADPKQSSYHRQSVAQPSLSRVSQTQNRYLLGDPSSPKQSYHSHPSAHAQQSAQQAQYGYDTGGGYSRSNHAGASGRYAEVYASAASGGSSGWYR